MAILDIILLFCFVPAIVTGISKGLVKQVVDILSLVLGATAAIRFTPVVSGWLTSYVAIDGKLLYVLSFAIILVAVCTILSLIGGLMNHVVKITALGWANRVLGVLFGIFKTALLIGLVILVFEGLNDKWNLVPSDKFDGAVVYEWLKNFSIAVFPKLKTLVTGGTMADA